jgi:hypothetical protein
MDAESHVKDIFDQMEIATTANGAQLSNGVNGPTSKSLNGDLAELKVNQNRLMNAIHEGCRFGEAHRYGRYANVTVREFGLIMK